jgi:type VI protein secretion system component VasK
VANAGATTGSSDSQDAYNALKAYLMLTSGTSDRDKVDPDFLAPYLLQRWMSAHLSSSDTDRDLAKRQFEFFAGKLKSEGALAKTRDEAIVERARNSLGALGSVQRTYQDMLSKAAGGVSSVQFNNREVLINSHAVPAVYTKAAWKPMLDALQSPQRFSTGEQWVLGGTSGKQLTLSEAEALRRTYVQRYILEWREFVKSAKVQKFNNLADAATKLRTLSAGSSPLLEFLFRASDNTNQDEELKGAFQAVQSFMKETSPNNFIGPANMAYMNAMFQLSLLVDRIESSGPNQNDLDQALMAAFTAQEKAGLASQAMGNDPLAKTVGALLESPIRMTREFLQSEKGKIVSPK